MPSPFNPSQNGWGHKPRLNTNQQTPKNDLKSISDSIWMTLYFWI
jgi:hypothetical protein